MAKRMDILEVKQVNDTLAEMVALFRVELRLYKGIVSKPNIEAGRDEIAASNGDDTVYNYVPPNNHRMIEFLRDRGYTVLNLIEIRKPYKDEKLTQTIMVGEHEFDYWGKKKCT